MADLTVNQDEQKSLKWQLEETIINSRIWKDGLKDDYWKIFYGSFKKTQTESFYQVGHFPYCKQHRSRSTLCFNFLTLHKHWQKVPTEHLELNQNVTQTS